MVGSLFNQKMPLLQLSIFLFCSFLFIQVTEGADCANITDCKSCVLKGAGCVWCILDGSEECMQGSFQGSSIGKNYCNDFYWGQCGVRGRIFKIPESYLVIAAIIVFILILAVFLCILCCCHYCDCCHKGDDDDGEKEKKRKEKKKNELEMSESQGGNKKSESEYDQRRKEMFNQSSYEKNPDPIPLSKSSSNQDDRPPSYPLYKPPTDEPPVSPHFSISIEDRPPTPPQESNVKYSSSNYSNMPPPQQYSTMPSPSGQREEESHYSKISIQHTHSYQSPQEDSRPPTPPDTPKYSSGKVPLTDFNRTQSTNHLIAPGQYGTMPMSPDDTIGYGSMPRPMSSQEISSYGSMPRPMSAQEITQQNEISSYGSMPRPMSSQQIAQQNDMSAYGSMPRPMSSQQVVQQNEMSSYGSMPRPQSQYTPPQDTSSYGTMPKPGVSSQQVESSNNYGTMPKPQSSYDDSAYGSMPRPMSSQPSYTSNGVTMADFDTDKSDFGDIEKTLASLQMDLDKDF